MENGLMEKKKGNKIIIIAVFVLLAIVVGVIVIFNFKKDEVYRLLKVYEVEGKANVSRDGTGDIEPYENMVLESGDKVSLETGKLTIKADEDKYIYLEDNTELVLVAEGNAQNSKTSIDLLKGAITNDIQNKLSSESSYEINTPNSTMSVRGTIYRVCVYEIDGVKYTKVSVFEGEVVTRLRYADGTYSDKEVSVTKGKEVIIYDDGTNTDYVSDPTDIDYNELPDNVLKLIEIEVEDDRDIPVEPEEIERILNGPFTVIFNYQGSEFGRQTVEKNGNASIPVLSPDGSGSWDFDFSTPIDRDTTIEWK